MLGLDELRAETEKIAAGRAGIKLYALRWRQPTTYFTLKLRQTEVARLEASRGYLKKIVYLWRRLRFEALSQSLGLSIPLGVFAQGLSIAHTHGIVVNGSAKVGTDCRIHQGVTIGAIKGSAPVIGDNVFIGPNAVVLGPITVGDGAHISAGVVLTSSLPAGAVAYPTRPTISENRARDWRNGV